MTDEPDFLCIVQNAWGGGSWARGKDRAKTIKQAARQYREDWGHLLKIGKKGTKLKVNVLDVTGLADPVAWDNVGFYEGDDRKPITRVPQVEIYTY